MVRNCFATLLRTCAAIALVPAAAIGTACAQDFAGKTITLTIGYGPGSGNDIYGRLVARHLGKHIPAKPVIVPQNLPGAGSFKAANYLFNTAPKDGTSLGYISQNAAAQQALGNRAINFKTEQFGWVGRISTFTVVSVSWHTSKVKAIQDAMKHAISIGATGAGSAVYIYPNVLNKVLGLKFKIVAGYRGTAQTSIAMERGELEAVSMGWTTINATKKHWLDKKLVNLLVQYRGSKHPDLPTLPTLVDLARTPDEKLLFQLFANDGEIGKGILTPPGVPAKTLAVLRKAFEAMNGDPAYIADSKKVKTEREWSPGDKLQKLIESVVNTPPAVIARAKTLLK